MLFRTFYEKLHVASRRIVHDITTSRKNRTIKVIILARQKVSDFKRAFACAIFLSFLGLKLYVTHTTGLPDHFCVYDEFVTEIVWLPMSSENGSSTFLKNQEDEVIR